MRERGEELVEQRLIGFVHGEPHLIRIAQLAHLAPGVEAAVLHFLEFHSPDRDHVKDGTNRPFANLAHLQEASGCERLAAWSGEQ